MCVDPFTFVLCILGSRQLAIPLHLPRYVHISIRYIYFSPKEEFEALVDDNNTESPVPSPGAFILPCASGPTADGRLQLEPQKLQRTIETFLGGGGWNTAAICGEVETPY